MTQVAATPAMSESLHSLARNGTRQCCSCTNLPLERFSVAAVSPLSWFSASDRCGEIRFVFGRMRESLLSGETVATTLSCTAMMEWIGSRSAKLFG